MPFTEIQNKALAAKLSGKHVKTREEAGRILYYLEGWYVISEANRTFGFDAWGRKTLQTQCIWRGEAKGLRACSYRLTRSRARSCGRHNYRPGRQRCGPRRRSNPG